MLAKEKDLQIGHERQLSAMPRADVSQQCLGYSIHAFVQQKWLMPEVQGTQRGLSTPVRVNLLAMRD